jgi:hypothetical protein
MKYFVLTAAALMMTISASAATIVSVSCGSFDFGGTGGSGTFVCPTLSSIDNGGTPIAEEIIYNQDYSNGLANPTTTQTIFGFSAGAANASDTLTSTGGSSSNPATSGDGAAFVALSVGPPAEHHRHLYQQLRCWQFTGHHRFRAARVQLQPGRSGFGS